MKMHKKGLVSENLLAVNVLQSPKNCWNLHKSTFILLFCHSEPNWVGKSQFQSYLRFWDCLGTPWLPTTSILILIGRIYHYQFKCSYLKNLELSSLSISKVIDSKRHAYLNAKKGLVYKNPLALSMLTSPKNCWNLQKSTFIQLFHHSEPDWIGKSQF